MNHKNNTVIQTIRKGEVDLLNSINSFPSYEKAKATGECSSEILIECIHSSQTPYSPWIYFAYYKIGSWLMSGEANQHNSIYELVKDVKESVNKSASTTKDRSKFCAYGDPQIASLLLWQSVLKLFQDGGDFIDDLEAPTESLLEHWQQGITTAHTLIHRVDNELSNLMEQLQRLLILAQPGPLARAEGVSFGGATCFFFRGATVINASRSLSIVEIIEKLVHEYAHAELFVLGQDQPLCLNNDDERHQVLIRSDPRPMNGILHSLYVTGRVAELLNLLLADGLNDIPHRDSIITEANSMLEQQLSFGQSSLEQVQQHAELTQIGNTVVADSRRRLETAKNA